MSDLFWLTDAQMGVCSGAVQNDTLSSQNTFPVVA